MMNIREYLDGIFNTKGYDAWETANNELIDLYNADNEDYNNDIDAHRVDDWAKAHNVDLDNDEFKYWYWDNFED